MVKRKVGDRWESCEVKDLEVGDIYRFDSGEECEVTQPPMMLPDGTWMVKVI